MKHAGALTALCSPTVNCYRRLRKPRDKGNWGLDDRLASFRVKNYSKEETYVENRIPGGSCNPYVVLAANVAAGCSSFVGFFPFFFPVQPFSLSLPIPTFPFILPFILPSFLPQFDLQSRAKWLRHSSKISYTLCFFPRFQ